MAQDEFRTSLEPRTGPVGIKSHLAGDLVDHRKIKNGGEDWPAMKLPVVADGKWPGPGFPGGRRKLTLAGRAIAPRVSFRLQRWVPARPWAINCSRRQ